MKVTSQILAEHLAHARKAGISSPRPVAPLVARPPAKPEPKKDKATFLGA